MLARTKKRPIDELVTLKLRIHPKNVERVTRYVESISIEEEVESVPWREVAARRGNVQASVLRGSRSKAEITQTRLSELTGIPQRHISEMESGKRPIGKENARKLAKALNTDYRLFM
jgi:hypothetical protein